MNLIAVLSQDKLKLYVILVFICLTILSVRKQSPSNEIENIALTDAKFKIFSFAIGDTSNTTIKCAFFAKEPYKEFLKLKETSNVLFASSASFTSSIDLESNIPIGFCAENGEIINKMPHQSMDGLVIIDNDHPEINTMTIIDLDKDSSCNLNECDSHFAHKNIRNNPSETFSFISALEKYKISSFQTQLVYSKFKTDSENFVELNNGTNDRSRRFLAICEKDNVLYHVVIDCFEEDYLMVSAKNALEHLRQSHYKVDYMVNLDTGSKDIIHAHDGKNLKNLRPNSSTSSAMIENASSLLVYYIEI